MIVILAVDKNFAIGKDNKLLFHIKEDLQHFKKTTLDSIVIMGRKTYESMGGGLKNRDNIVLSRDENYKLEDAKVFSSKEDVLSYVNKNKNKKAFVIGGQKIVDLFLDNCNEAILTKVLDEVKDVDCYLHNFDHDDNFEIVEQSDLKEDSGKKFFYVKYRRKK